MNSFKRLIDKLAKKSGVFSEIKVRLILDEWDDIIGSPLSSKTKPVALKGGVLYVLCEDPLWAQELRFYTDDILIKLKSKLKDTRDVNAIKIIRRSEEVARKIYS